MNNYLKILLTTLGIQLGAFIVAYVIYNINIETGILKSIALGMAVVCIPVSIIVDIILAVKWGSGLYQRLLYIFLMPTNYTWIIYILLLIWFTQKSINLLQSIPENFG